ncbi:MAG TPA: CopD family protein [Pseudonocardia sp.]
MSSPRSTASTGGRWRPVGWLGLTVATAAVAAVLAGGLAVVTLPVLLGATFTRSAADAAGVAAVGLALVATLLPLGHPRPPRELPGVLRGVDRATVAVAGGWVAFTLLGVGFRAAEAYGRSLGELGSTELTTFALSLSAGRGLLLTAGCAAATGLCAALRTRDRERVPPRVVLVVALLGTLTPALTGHAGTSSDHELAVITVALHVAAAALWVGGLGAVLVVAGPRPRLLAAVLPRFSMLAGGCLACVVVSGVLNAVLRVASWEALVTTGYGLLVLAKSVCVVVLAGLGGLARRRLAAGTVPVLRWAGAEIALMGVTIGLAAALTQAA